MPPGGVPGPPSPRHRRTGPLRTRPDPVRHLVVVGGRPGRRNPGALRHPARPVKSSDGGGSLPFWVRPGVLRSELFQKVLDLSGLR